ncbi:NAD(P)-binding protein [Rhodohalobacter sp.]|uniref:NAD(P)-binding protein n=1 Tax=Rhodohalobacter sp. TaxID=1974210 RepID=UPI002ACE7D34|nr:NAD(P)-binding protein [Rhodohalobacter sp.]MDZ7756340.1 NAD(P)-binding protein [Rhodohalobacter sp.]
MINKKKVCVLGAGISGLSTASLLTELGYQVHIITKDDPRTVALNPEFSSLFPAASIIPHAVHSDELIEIFRISKNHFESLYIEQFPGVTTTKHYELFAHPKEVPDYTRAMDHFQVLNEFKMSLSGASGSYCKKRLEDSKPTSQTGHYIFLP